MRALPSGFLLLTCLLGGDTARAAAPAIWGDLEPGPWPVGFRTLYLCDLSRPSLPGGEVTCPRGRPMPVSFWYPAAPTPGAAAMLLGDYADRAAQDLDFTPLSAERRAAWRARLAAELSSAGAAQEAVDRLLLQKTAAVADAPAAAGPFPLVIFGHASPVLQSVASEYLASHGFVIGTVPSRGTRDVAYRHELPDLETLVIDLSFAAGALRALPQVAAGRWGMIGMSAGSVAALGLAARNPDVGGLVSLDGGIGERRGSQLASRLPSPELSQMRTPLLHLYTPDNPNLDLSRLRSWTSAPRTLVELPGLRHGDFLALGMFERFAPRLLGEPARDHRSGCEWIWRTVRHFLAAELYQDAAARGFLARSPAENGVPAGLLEVERLPALPPPAAVSSPQTP